MYRPFLALVPALACLGLPVAAQDVDCADAMAQVDLTACAYQEWQAADATLNEVYAQAMTLLKDWDAGLPAEYQGGAEALKVAQRAWVTFRDKACEAEGYAMRGGSAEPLLVYGCMRVITEERVGHLTAMVEAYR